MPGSVHTALVPSWHLVSREASHCTTCVVRGMSPRSDIAELGYAAALARGTRHACATGMKRAPKKGGSTSRGSKNPHAAALGRLGGLKGGRARAAALTPEE